MSSPRDDLELMQMFDGETAGDEAALDADQRAKLAALEQVGDAVRTHLELAADAAEPKLDAMWATIERRIHANGKAPAEPAKAPAKPAQPGWFSRWLENWRSNLMTGALAAAAAAVLVIALRPPRTEVRTVEVTPPVDPVKDPPTALVKSEPPVVEDLEVVGGSGTILTIPGEEGENPTTVIWVNTEPVEGPI